jgi:hypothetical protein
VKRALLAFVLLAVACAREQPPNPAPQLAQLRAAIREYHARHQQYPRRLQDLGSPIPIDPVTKKADWRVITEEPVAQNDFGVGTPAPRGGGIVDVRSAAAGHDANGKAWSDY